MTCPDSPKPETAEPKVVVLVDEYHSVIDDAAFADRLRRLAREARHGWPRCRLAEKQERSS